MTFIPCIYFSETFLGFIYGNCLVGQCQKDVVAIHFGIRTSFHDPLREGTEPDPESSLRDREVSHRQKYSAEQLRDWPLIRSIITVLFLKIISFPFAQNGCSLRQIDANLLFHSFDPAVYCSFLGPRFTVLQKEKEPLSQDMPRHCSRLAISLQVLFT